MVKNNLKNYIDDFFDAFELYDDYRGGHDYKTILKTCIHDFLDNQNPSSAFEVYETFLMIYQITYGNKSQSLNVVTAPNIPLDFAKTVFKYERIIKDHYKDTFIHSVNVFLLGLAIYSQNKNYRKAFQNYVMRSDYEKYYKDAYGKLSDEEFLYRWGIAALFYDIALPIELMGKPLKNSLNKKINSIFNIQGEMINFNLLDLKELNSISKIDMDFGFEYENTYPETRFLDLFKPTDILSHKVFLDFKLNKKQLNYIRDFTYKKFIIGDCPCKDNEYKDHGLVSAIIVLDLYGYLMQHNVKRHEFFFYPIVDSAGAILLHNYYSRILQKEPFNLAKLDSSESPLAYLLILCDNIQTWEIQSFGINDKSPSNESIEINDNRILVKYILKSSEMDPRFEKDREAFIYKVLDIHHVFPENLSVKIINDAKFETETLLNIDIQYIQYRDIPINIIEKLAKKINMQYNINDDKLEVKKKTIEIGDERETELFNALSSDLKLSYVRQAKSIPKKLAIIDYEIAPADDKRPTITEFLDGEVEYSAEYEHQEWIIEKKRQGWDYGEEKDIENKVTPYLVLWNNLDSKTKQSYIDSIKNIPYLLESIGLKVVKSKIKYLAFEIHKDYLEEKGIMSIKVGDERINIKEITSEELFKLLPNHIQYFNDKQTKYMVKLLKELKYELVDIDNKRPGINDFTKAEIEYFSRRQHEDWYNLKVNLGWTYGTGGKEKTSPNLVPWDDLPVSVKEDYRCTFENLPRICHNVGLKIVKIN